MYQYYVCNHTVKFEICFTKFKEFKNEGKFEYKLKCKYKNRTEWTGQDLAEMMKEVLQKEVH